MLEEQIEKAARDETATQSNDYERLRSLLLGEDYEKIIQQRLTQENIDRFAEVISEAFKLRNQQDSSLATEMSPVIEASIDTSIKNHPERITNVIFPIIGPAVRKAVANAFSDMMHSLNHLLQQSLTAQALIWRFRAWRLGLPYAQYVLLQTIQYQVEQVFLIHRNSGVLIQSTNAEGIKYQDPDLVSSMLTAITDFANDSFNQESDSLNVLQFGDLSLLVETGPHAVLAFAVRGTLNNEVKQHISELLERIHVSYAQQLNAFDGDTTPFEPCIDWLQKALLKKEKTTPKSRPWLAIVTVVLISSVASFFIYQNWQLKNSISRIVEQVNNQVGFQVLRQTYHDNELHLLLLRSPLAISIEDLTDSFKTRDFTLVFKEKLTALDSPELFIPYLAHKYQSTLSINSQDLTNDLVVSGTIRAENLTALKQDTLVKNYFNLVLSKTLILTTDLLPQQKNRLEIKSLVNKINNQYFYFNISSTQLQNDSRESLNATIEQIKRVIHLEKLANVSIKQIGISGYADSRGNKRPNQDLSANRAKFIKNILTANGITDKLIISWGYGNKDLPSVPSNHQRRARIEVLYIPNLVPEHG